MFSHPPLRKAHWKAPTIITMAFLAALGFAIGHHEFYRHLDGQIVDTGDRLFTQQVNLAIGNAFALLFRAALVIALGTVYWQVFWTTLLRQRKSLAVSHIDAMAGALASLFDLLHLRATLRRRTLLALALLTWLLPLAAVLPPATLSVEVTRHMEDGQQEVPSLDFSNPSLIYTDNEYRREADGETFVDVDGLWQGINVTAGPSSELYDLLHYVATSHEISNFPGIGTNKSYELSFPGSTLQCENISDEDLQFFRGEFACKGSPSSCGIGPVANEKIYASWIPQHRTSAWKPLGPEESRETGEEVTVLIPTQKASRDYTTLWFQGSDAPSRPSSVYGSPYLLIATRPFLPSPHNNGTTLGDWGILNCSLHYATYTAIVHSSDDRSVISNYSVEPHSEIVLPATGNLQASSLFSYPDPSDFGQLALLSCLDYILAGDLKATRYSSSVTPGSDSQPISGSSKILETNLIHASELLLANELYLGYGGYSYNVTEHYWNESSFDDVVVEASTFNRSLALAIPELYHNMTLSLFSRKRFQAVQGSSIKIKTELWHNTYTYRSSNLLMSYGIALVLSLIACVLGCATIFTNGGSYSNRFSTILRIARGVELADFDTLLTEEDRNGTDPLSRHLATTHLVLGREAGKDSVDICESGAVSQKTAKAASEQDALMEHSQSEDEAQITDDLPAHTQDVHSRLGREPQERLQPPIITGDESSIRDEGDEDAARCSASSERPIVATSSSRREEVAADRYHFHSRMTW